MEDKGGGVGGTIIVAQLDGVNTTSCHARWGLNARAQRRSHKANTPSSLRLSGPRGSGS